MKNKIEYQIEKQHAKGKLHAIERLNALLDENSFNEIFSAVRHNCTSFGMSQKEIPYDGVITGFGTINGRKVAVYAQDFTVQGGSLGYMHGQKIAQIIKMAIDARCPVIGINDSGGARIQEGVSSLAGYGELFYQNVRASGYIPQISIIAGPCAGGAVYSPGITDFIFTVDKISCMFITGPKVVKSVMFMDITEEELGGGEVHAQKSGVTHFRCPDENDCYQKARKLLDYIPHYYGDNSPFIKNELDDTGNNIFQKIHGMKTHKKSFEFSSSQKAKHIVSLLPERSNKGYDMHDIIDCITDDNSFLETSAEFATNILTGFATIEGSSIGIVANNPSFLGGVLNCDSSDKAARFIRYCDAFNIPLLNLVDIPGFIPGPQEEQKGIIRHGAKLIYAYSEATVPKVTIIIRKAYGGAYIAMCSKHLAADFVFAWPSAEIAVMGAEGAAGILYAKDMKDPTKAQEIQSKIEEYRNTVMTPDIAAERGYISEIIEPEETRERIVSCFSFLKNKSQNSALIKKHGNIPL